ncbi:MAG: hypothetical protein SGILL_004366 [Bacillariaceae sp.]
MGVQKEYWSLQDATSDTAQTAYLAQHPLLDQIPSLFLDVEDDPCGVNPTNVNVWMGTGGTRTPLHFDSYDNLLVQIVGAKYVRLYAREHTPKLYVSTNKSYGLQGNMSDLDCEMEDFTKHPLAKDCPYEEVLLLPGDCLFIPSQHWHYRKLLVLIEQACKQISTDVMRWLEDDQSPVNVQILYVASKAYNIAMNEDDEAMEAASNVMETTTNSSSSSGSSVMEDAASEKEEVTMEDAVSPPNDDIAMQDEEGNEEMGVATASMDEEVDEPMEDKADIPKEETMKVADSKEVDAPIPKKMSDASPEKPEQAEDIPKKEKTLTADATSDFRKSLGLHDCLSLGEIELGLINQKRHSQDATSDDSASANHHRAKLEIQRLPYILRLLSSTRPLASISVMDLLEQRNNDSIQSDEDDQKPPADALLDGVVESLEDVAATYSIAEAVDVVANHLAPSLTKKISRLKPLQYSVDSDGTLQWDTDALADVAKDPIAIPTKRKRGAKASTPADKGAPGGGTSLSLSSDDAASTDDDPGESSVPLKKRKQNYRRDSVEVAAEDSQEATFTKTLSELAALVVRSLKNNGSENTEAQTEEDDPDSAGKESGGFSLRTDDSILAEAFRGANEGTGGAMEGSDLGSTVTTIMHHAPVIRSRQLAGALCRASLQQTGDLVSRLAANCPTCSPALLLGCIETYSTAIKCKNTGIADTAKECAMALAKLSNNERTRVYNKLQASGVMLDVQLRLATELGCFQLSCFLTQHLIPLTTSMADGASTTRNTIPRLQRQDSRDSSGGIPNDENEDLDETSPSEGIEPTLLFHLLNNSKLYAETIECLGTELSKSDDNFRQSQGRRCLTLRSLALLLLAPLRDTEVVKIHHSALVKVSEQVCNAMQHLDLGSTHDKPTVPDCASTDGLYGLFSSCGFLLMAMMLTHENSDNNDVETRIAEQIFEAIKRMHKTSQFLDRSWNSVQNAMTRECPRSLFTCFVTPIAASMNESVIDMFAESILVGLKALCRTFGTRAETSVARDKQTDLNCRAAALLQLFRESTSCDMGKIVALTKDLMSEFLENDQDIGASLLVCSTDVLRFIAEGTKLLSREESTQVPFVLPVKLDETWTKISVDATGDCVNDTESTFLLRLLYALEYMDRNTSTLFAVDPWFLPIKQAMAMTERVPSKHARDFLSQELRRFVKKYCLDLTVPTFFERTAEVVAPFDTMTREKLMETLYLSIRSIVNKETTTVNDIGFLFLQVRSLLCDADLYSTVSSACLSSPNNPTPRYSYSLLCQDPLVVLRYPLAVWSKKCLRKILLTTLRATLVAHNAITFRDSPRDGSAEELLVARDAIITRCLLAVTHGGDSNDPQICSATTSFIRWLICNRPGLVGLLVKQGLGESDVDWLVENVPEIMSDAQSLLHILSDRSFMTASERLAMADTISRIAIVHGSDFNDNDAAQMTAGALSQLVDSFYLVLGPVGVPVTALLNENSGTDITQGARKAAFRILKALIKVRGRRHAFQVCGAGLQKLATMCKGESTSMQGATAAPKRKQLLKEVYDTAAKAVGISGGGHS